MHIDDIGQGPALLFLHGLPMAPASCMSLAKHFTQTHRVLIPHLPGYGPSSPLEPYDFQVVEDQLVEQLHEMGVSELAAVVAISGGSYRALRMAAGKRMPMGAVCAFAPTAGPFDDGQRELFHNYAAAVRAGVDLSEPAMQAVTPAFLKANPHYRGELLSWITDIAPEPLAQELLAYAALPHLGDALSTIDVPVVIRVGDGDLQTPPEEVARIASAIPNASYTLVPGVRHMLWWEDEQGSVDAVRSVLA